MHVTEKMRLLNERRAAGDTRDVSVIVSEIEDDYLALNPLPNASDVVGSVKRVGEDEKEVLGDGTERAKQ